MVGKYNGDVEMMGDTLIGEPKYSSALRFSNIEAYYT